VALIVAAAVAGKSPIGPPTFVSIGTSEVGGAKIPGGGGAMTGPLGWVSCCITEVPLIRLPHAP